MLCTLHKVGWQKCKMQKNFLYSIITSQCSSVKCSKYIWSVIYEVQTWEYCDLLCYWVFWCSCWMVLLLQLIISLAVPTIQIWKAFVLCSEEAKLSRISALWSKLAESPYYEVLAAWWREDLLIQYKYSGTAVPFLLSQLHYFAWLVYYVYLGSVFSTDVFMWQSALLAILSISASQWVPKHLNFCGFFCRE